MTSELSLERTSFQQVGGVPGAAVDQGGDIVGQLNGGDLSALLTDGHGQGVAVVPGAAHGLGILRAGQDARLLIQLYPSLLPQAEALGIVPQAVDAQLAAHLIEEVVAGVGDGLADGLISVGIAVLPVDPAHGAVLGVIGVPALVLDLGVGGDDALLQSGDAGDHLKGGAGGVQALEHPVEQGLQWVGGILGVVRVVLGQVEGRVGGAGLDPRVVHVQNDAGGALYLLALQLGQALGQHPLHHGSGGPRRW